MAARDTVVFASGGAASAVAYAVLSWKSHTTLVPLSVFFACLGAAAAISIALYLRYRASDLTRGAFTQVILWACVFRIIGLAGTPLYEDDFYRYLWDGRTFAVTGNPYDHAPADSFGDDTLDPKFQNILSRVNYPEVRTIYGPVCQLAFLAAYAIAPGELWPLKLIFLAADLCIVWLLWKMAGKSAALLLYAWSPLVIKEIAFTAHTDVLAALFVTAAIFLVRRDKLAAGAVNLAVAVASKVVAMAAVPVLLGRKRWRGWGIFVTVLAVLYLPFAFAGRSELGGLGAFASEWEFNSFGFVLLKAVFGSAAARVASMLVFAGFYIWYLGRRQNEPNLAVIFGVFFFLAPVVNPWYLLILAPVVALKPDAWSIVALQSVLLSYITTGNLNQGGGPGLFDHPWWVRPAEILPVALLLIWQWWTSRRPRPAASPLLFVETKGATS